MKITCFVILLLEIIDVTAVESFSTPTDCTRRCSVMDSTLNNCWDQSLDYFTEALIQSLNSYVSSLLHIDRWKTRHPEDAASKFERFEEISLDRVLAKYSNNSKLVVNGPLNETLLRQIIQDVINMTANLKPNYAKESNRLPSYTCPIPCDYYPKIWMALFFITFTVFILTGISIMAYFCVNTDHKVPAGFRKIYQYKRAS